MMSFLLQPAEPAGKLKRIFDEAEQEDVALLRHGINSNRWNRSKDISVPHDHALYGKGKNKSMSGDESEMPTNNQLFIS